MTRHGNSSVAPHAARPLAVTSFRMRLKSGKATDSFWLANKIAAQIGHCSSVSYVAHSPDVAKTGSMHNVRSQCPDITIAAWAWYGLVQQCRSRDHRRDAEETQRHAWQVPLKCRTAPCGWRWSRERRGKRLAASSGRRGSRRALPVSSAIARDYASSSNALDGSLRCRLSRKSETGFAGSSTTEKFSPSLAQGCCRRGLSEAPQSAGSKSVVASGKSRASADTGLRPRDVRRAVERKRLAVVSLSTRRSSPSACRKTSREQRARI